MKWVRPGARTFDSSGMHLEEIITAIEDGYRAGGKVVRLHTGDPSLYGAIFEQITALKKKGISYAVIPGVTAAFAAAAAMGIEYTMPEVCQTLILTRAAGRTPVPDGESLAALARHGASMVIYLSAHLVDSVSEILKEHYGEDAVCIVAYRVSHPDERVITTTVGALAQTMKKEDIQRQALIIVGRVLGLEDALWVRSKLYTKDFSHGFRR